MTSQDISWVAGCISCTWIVGLILDSRTSNIHSNFWVCNVIKHIIVSSYDQFRTNIIWYHKRLYFSILHYHLATLNNKYYLTERCRVTSEYFEVVNTTHVLSRVITICEHFRRFKVLYSAVQSYSTYKWENLLIPVYFTKVFWIS